MANKVSLNPKPPFDFIVFPFFMEKIILIKREKKKLLIFISFAQFSQLPNRV